MLSREELQAMMSPEQRAVYLELDSLVNAAWGNEQIAFVEEF